jgi:hypothetical protein
MERTPDAMQACLRRSRVLRERRRLVFAWHANGQTSAECTPASPMPSVPERVWRDVFAAASATDRPAAWDRRGHGHADGATTRIEKRVVVSRGRISNLGSMALSAGSTGVLQMKRRAEFGRTSDRSAADT